MGAIRCQAILDAMVSALVVVARDGTVLHLNQAARTFLRLPGSTRCPPWSHLPFFNPPTEGGRRLLALVEEALEGRGLVDRCLPLDDDQRAFLPQPMQMRVSLAPLGDPGAPPTAALVNWRLEPQDRGKGAQWSRLRQLEDVVDKSAAVIFIKDLSSRYILANQAFLRLFDLHSAVGLLDTHLFSPEVAQVLRDNDRAVLEGRRPLRIEERVPSHGVERIFLALKFPLFDDEGRVNALCGIATDITDVKRTEQENKRLTIAAQAAKEASKLKSHFLATMSHEIRTPLAGIIGLSGLLNHSGLEPHQQNLADRIGTAANDLLAILNDILDVSKLEAGKVAFEAEPVSLELLQASVRDTFGPLATKKGIRLALQVAPATPPWVLGDATRLRQVVFNLISNALKFSSRGEVRLEVATRPDLGPRRGAGAGAEAGGREGQAPGRAPPSGVAVDAPLWLEASVTDQGIGIRAEDHEKVFALFHQADATIARRFGGTGLGLSICRSIVEGQGGQMGAEGTPGVGSRFWFRLPTRACAAPAASPRRPAAAAGRLAGRVLVAEDNPINQLVVLTMLERLGLKTVLAADGAEAVRLATAGPFDAILMDCHMPRVDGLEATRRIRRLPGHHHTPIVALTANAMRGEQERCLAAGMNAHLIKPVHEEALAELLARWLRGAGPSR